MEAEDITKKEADTSEIKVEAVVVPVSVTVNNEEEQQKKIENNAETVKAPVAVPESKVMIGPESLVWITPATQRYYSFTDLWGSLSPGQKESCKAAAREIVLAGTTIVMGYYGRKYIMNWLASNPSSVMEKTKQKRTNHVIVVAPKESKMQILSTDIDGAEEEGHKQ